RTAPVKYSAGPLTEGWEPARLICIRELLLRSLFEDILGDRKRREGVGPAGVEGEVRNDLRRLRPGQTVVHRSVQVVRNLGHLTRGDQGADGHEAPVSRRQSRTQPQLAEQDVGRVLNDPRGYGAKLLPDTCSALRFGGFVEGKKRRGSRGQLRRCDSAP